MKSETIPRFEDQCMISRSIPFIFLDMDETLISTVYRYTDGDTRKSFKIDDYWYSSMVRPLAQEFISGCRSLTHTMLFTNATRDYAKKINEMFGFGFDCEQMICREDYIVYVPDYFPYSHSSTEIATVPVTIDLPKAILVDNMYPDDVGALQKMKYLGINSDRYVQIREFTGKDPECFKNELVDVIEKIKRLVNE